MALLLRYFPTISALVSLGSLFFPSIISSGQTIGVLSFWDFCQKYPIGYLVPLGYGAAVATYFLPPKYRKILFGVLHFSAFSLFCYLVFRFSNTDADIPNKYIPVMAGNFFLPLFTAGYYLFNRKVTQPATQRAGLPKLESQHEYSAIVIANQLAELLRAHAQAPLSEENLVFQTDALSRLDDPEAEEWGPFARFEYARLENDTAFPFSLLLFRDGFVIGIADMVSFSYPYTQFSTDYEAADQLFLALTLLLSGQIEILLSIGKKGLYAMEILLYKHDRLQATVIDTNATFPFFGIKDPITERLRNTVSAGFTEIADDFFMHRLQPDGYFPPTGRVLTVQDSEALSRKEYKEISAEQAWAGTGKPLCENHWQFIYRHWEFWALIGTCYGVIGLLYVTGIIKDPSFFQHGSLYLVPTTAIVTIAMPWILRKKQQKKSASTNNTD